MAINLRFSYLGLQRSIIRNIVSLYVLQFADYIIPLIMVSYLTRRLGPEGYGSITFAHALINYINIFVDYNFNLSATRDISIFRHDHRVVNHIAYHVWMAKGLLSLIGLAVLFIIITFVPKIRNNFWLFIFLYGVVLGNVFFPKWLFQGMDQMVIISLINLGVKIFILGSVFLLVQTPEDKITYAWLVGGGYFVAGLVGFLIAVYRYKLYPIKTSFFQIYQTLREGWFLFITSVSVSLYTSANVVILGILSNYEIVGYFSIADKIIRAIISLNGPIMSAFYPFSCRNIGTKEYFSLLRKIFFLLIVVGLIILFGIFKFSESIIVLFAGNDFLLSSLILKVLSPLIIIIFISHITSSQILIPLKLDKPLFIILFLAGIANILLSFIFVPMFGALGMAAIVLFVELSITLSQIILVKSKVGLSWLWKK